MPDRPAEYPAERPFELPAEPAPPAVYPPPPELYERAAQAAPTFVTPAYSPEYDPRVEQRPRSRRRLRRTLSAQQPTSELDIAVVFLSAAVSFAVYAVILGWRLGLGLVALLFVHEMGHFIVIRAKGLPARLPIFVPLIGAFVLMGQASISIRDDAEIALAGPFAGALGSLVCALAYWVTGATFLLPLASINLAINLFNLAPIWPLDGARASRAISKRVMLPGMIVVAVAALCTLNIVGVLVAGVALFQVFTRAIDATLGYVSRRERAYVTTLYFGLIVALLVGLLFTTFGLLWLQAISWLLPWPGLHSYP